MVGSVNGKTNSMELREDLRRVEATLGTANNNNEGGGWSSNNTGAELSGKGQSNTRIGTAVKRGTAESFDPSVFAKKNPNFNDNDPSAEVDNGMFVDRNKRDSLIMEKFVPVDEETVMQQIIDERDVEIKKINAGIHQVHDMFVDLARLVKEQEDEVQTIFNNVDDTHSRAELALRHIIEAERLQKNGSCIIS
mmetsp:Transcript_24812/g.41338  ORF Transcript_24812/g.41338 Transcript_24812/m.41338 type:complete len:193 (+) Transcript_24812:301-879(+)